MCDRGLSERHNVGPYTGPPAHPWSSQTPLQRWDQRHPDNRAAPTRRGECCMEVPAWTLEGLIAAFLGGTAGQDCCVGCNAAALRLEQGGREICLLERWKVEALVLVNWELSNNRILFQGWDGNLPAVRWDINCLVFYRSSRGVDC